MAMLSLVAATLGALVLGVAAVDAATTVVGVGAARGPVTRHVSRALWWLALRLHDRTASQAPLLAGGPVILVAIIGTWVVAIIVGWALVFGAEGAVITIQQGEPVPGFGRLHYASSLVLGRGSPVYEPGTDLYRVLEQLAAATGVALFSLGIAYVIPVVNAAVQKRRVASYISALGRSPQRILSRAWADGAFGHLDLHLIALAPMLNELAERHLAYPVLFYFHSAERHSAIGPSIAVLDETLTLLDCCTPDVQIETGSVVPVRAAISEFLDTLYHAFIDASDAPVPEPDVAALREAGIPLVSDEEIEGVLEGLADRRRLLRAMLEHDGWAWSEVTRPAWTEGWAMELGDGQRR